MRTKMRDYWLPIYREIALINNESNLKTSFKEGDNETEMLDKSHDPDKSEFHSEQIDSPSTSKNLDNWDRDSEEWEYLSNKENGPSRKQSPKDKNGDKRILHPGNEANQDSSRKPKQKKSSKKKIIVINSAKKKVQTNGVSIKGLSKMPKLQHLGRQELYLAVGPGAKNNPSARKSKINSQSRQLTSKTDDIYNREGGEYIKKITQRTNTKFSNFSEFPNQVKEKQVKLNSEKLKTESKFRSRTVKRRLKGASKLGSRSASKRQHNLKYYNIITNLQKKPKVSPKRLCWDFWNSEIVKSNADPSEASNLAISKFGRTNTGSVISEEDSSRNGNSKVKNK